MDKNKIMELVNFDTHSAVKGLVSTGISEAQAEKIVEIFALQVSKAQEPFAKKEAVKEIKIEFKTEINTSYNQLRTEIAEVRAELKEEIGNVRTELKSEIANVKAELKGDIAKLDTKISDVKSELLKWFIGLMLSMGISIIAANYAIIKILLP